MGHGPQNPTPTFHFVKIIFSHLILMGLGAGSTIVQAQKNSCDTDGAGSSMVQAYFCRDTDGARTTQSHTQKKYLILMGQDPRLSKHKKIHVIQMGQDPVLSKHIFVVILMGHGPHNPTPKKNI